MLPGAGQFVGDLNNTLHMGGVMAMQPGLHGDMMAGQVMSRGAAIGGPLLSGAQTLLGLDPLSLGMRAGMGMWRGGAGLLGAGAVGMGVMSGAAILGTGAAYAGHQMMTGAQQQLGLNHALRTNFNHMNSQGTLGFTTGQGFQIGASLRSMTGAMGPGGEVVGFDELSRLASNMGRMGMAQNVRTVSDFKDKFKEMVKTMTKIAQDMGSTMEEAQKFANTMKNSGIFKSADQLRMSAGMRQVAAAGGLAMSEVTGMAGIGSQISRSIGGLGRAGAFAGVRTMEQIGLAQRVGAISEEDIYNATGMTGGEGRQALGAAQLQQSARFISSRRGRYFLASIADKDGNINEEAAMEYLTGGGVTTGRTQQLAKQNLSGIGRFNFVRNEGRLRGAALERFGGMMQAMVYQQWLAGKHYDPSAMSDKGMIAFQRYTGMGRDEADLMIKQINALPEMAQEMQRAKGQLAYSDANARKLQNSGMVGLKRKFEAVRERVQNKMQAAGARILSAGSNDLAGWFNSTMGIYESNASEDIADITRQIIEGRGGAQLQRRMDNAFGSMHRRGGGGVLAAPGALQAQRLSKLAAAALGPLDTAAASVGAASAGLIIGASGRTNIRTTNAGFNAFQSKRDINDEIQGFIHQLRNGPNATAETIGLSTRILMAKTDEEKVGLIQSAQRGAGVDEADLIGTIAGTKRDAAYQNVFSEGFGLGMTREDKQEMAGRALSGMDKRTEGGAGLSGTEIAGIALATITGGATLVAPASSWAQRNWDRYFTDSRERAIAVGSLLDDPGMSGLFERSAAGEATDEDYTQLLKRSRSLRSSSDAGSQAQGMVLGNVALMATQGKDGAGLRATIEKLRTGQTVSQEEKQALSDAHRHIHGGPGLLDKKGNLDMESEAMRGVLAVGAEARGALGAKYRENYEEARKQLISAQTTLKDELLSTGVMTLDKEKGEYALNLTDEDKAAMGKGADLVNLTKHLAALDMSTNVSVEAAQGMYQSKRNIMYNMTAKERAETRKRVAGTSDAQTLSYLEQNEKRLDQFTKTFGPNGGAARFLGKELTKEQVKSIANANNKADAFFAASGFEITEGNKGAREELQKAWDEKNPVARADKLAAWKANNKEIYEKAQDDTARQNDPSARALMDIRDAVKTMAENRPATAAEIAAAVKGENPEGDGK